MNYPKYQTLTVSSDYTVYTFISTGLKGNFEIEIQFTPDQQTGIFNLGFGVLTENGEIDDIITLNNGDRDKILATVAGLADEFLQTHPDSVIFFSGSTPARTRLYRRAISINYDELKMKFEIFGVLPGVFSNIEVFKSQVNYKAFLIRRLTFDL